MRAQDWFYTTAVTLSVAAGFIAFLNRDGPPARLVAGTSAAADTVVVNNVLPVRIPLRVLDARGHVLSAAGVRYRQTSGVSVPISDSGTVTCTRSGDVVVRASLGAVTTNVVLRCRPVEKLYLPGVIDIVVGDSAEPVPVEAHGPDGRRVELLAGSARILDSTVATLEGLRIRPRSAGGTMVGVFVGDRGGWIQVDVYERASTPEGMSQDQHVAVPVRLASGETRRWRLTTGSYVLSMRPESSALRFALVNGGCGPIPFVRAYVCDAKADAALIVYNSWRKDATPELSGELAIRRLRDEKP